MNVDIQGNPPIIDDLGLLKGVAQMNIGNLITIHSLDWLHDGRVVGYLSIVRTNNIGHDARQLNQITYGPVGALIATPIESESHETLYEVQVPDPDAVSEAAVTRQKYENEQYAALHRELEIDSEDKLEHIHSELSENFPEFQSNSFDAISDLDLTPTEAFELGQLVGSKQSLHSTTRKLASGSRRSFSGDRRWDSPTYDVIRTRRTDSPLNSDFLD